MHDTAGTQSRRQLLGSFGYLTIAAVGGQLIGFVGLAIVARRIGPHDLGAYNFAANVAAFFALPFMAGLGMVGTRDIASDPDRRTAAIGDVQAMLLLNALVAYAVLIAARPLLTSDPLVRSLLPIVGATLVINALGLDWAMQGLQRSRALAAIRFGGQVAYIAALMLLLTRGAAGAKEYAVANAIGFAVTAVLSAGYVWRAVSLRYSLRGLRRSMKGARARLRRSLAPAASLVLVQVYYSVDVVIIGYLRGDHAVGEYATAERLPAAAITIASLWVTVFYPHAARLAQTDVSLLRKQVGEFASLAAVIALPLVPIGFIAGSRIMAGFFGAHYGAGGAAFAVMLVGAGVAIVNSTISQVLLAVGNDRSMLVNVAVGSGLNVALNLVLVPIVGIVGSALATVVAESVIVVMAIYALRATIGPIRIDWARVFRGVVAVALAAGVAEVLKASGPWWLCVGVYGVAVSALLVATGAVSVRLPTSG